MSDGAPGRTEGLAAGGREGALRTIVLVAIASALGALGFAGDAAAQVSAKDVQVMSRALGFVQLPADAAKLVVVYNPASAASVQAADAVRGLLGESFKAGARVLSVALVKVGELDTVSGVGVLLLASDLGPDVAKVAAVSQARKAPCITDDLDLVRRGACAIGVRTSPKVEIIISKAVTAAVGLTFDPAFKLLITEV